jgi:hypothetical protein
MEYDCVSSGSHLNYLLVHAAAQVLIIHINMRLPTYRIQLECLLLAHPLLLRLWKTLALLGLIRRQDFQVMLSKLRNATEIAVDLEHHSYRSYAGFLCLMQISDRDQDWIIDLLAVRDEIETLNEVFTDPAIVKVGYSSMGQ